MSAVREMDYRWERKNVGKLVAEKMKAKAQERKMVKACTDKGNGIITFLQLIRNRT